MADMLIKNMELPKEGAIDISIKADGTITSAHYRFDLPYKAVELPPHGEKYCSNCKWCHEGHYEEEGEQPYIKRKCSNKYGLNPNYSVYEHDYCSRWEGGK